MMRVISQLCDLFLGESAFDRHFFVDFWTRRFQAEHLQTGYFWTGHFGTGHFQTGHFRTGHFRTRHFWTGHFWTGQPVFLTFLVGHFGG